MQGEKVRKGDTIRLRHLHVHSRNFEPNLRADATLPLAIYRDSRSARSRIACKRRGEALKPAMRAAPVKSAYPRTLRWAQL